MLRGEKFGGSFHKTPRSGKVVRAHKRAAVDTEEEKERAKVRRRDKQCRMPLCGCRRFNLALAVCHTKHRGMGGNPKADRTQAPRMIYLCSARHRENAISLDRGTLKILPTSSSGYGGPCTWWVDINRLREDFGAHAPEWQLVGTETAVGLFDPQSLNLPVLEQLREMVL